MRGATSADWGVLELEGVRDVVRQAARRVNREYRDVTELEDLEQEALTLLATRDDLRQAAHDGELGLVQYRLELDLIDTVKYEARRAARTISYNRIEEQDEPQEGTFIRPYVALATASNEYTRESVESLLPAVWDESYAYGLPQKETAPDPDMPRGSSNKATGNNLSAYIADIKVGWEKAPLTLKERRALLLAFGFGWTQRQIAYNQGVSQQAIQHRIYTAVGKIVARLNGGIWYELEGVEA